MKKALVIAALVALAACGDRPDAYVYTPPPDFSSTSDSPAPDAPDPLVDYEVTDCSVDYDYATARVTFTVSEPFDYVGFSGDFTNDADEVIGQSIGNATDVVPGTTYKTEVIYGPLVGSSSGEPATSESIQRTDARAFVTRPGGGDSVSRHEPPVPVCQHLDVA